MLLKFPSFSHPLKQRFRPFQAQVILMPPQSFDTMEHHKTYGWFAHFNRRNGETRVTTSKKAESTMLKNSKIIDGMITSYFVKIPHPPQWEDDPEGSAFWNFLKISTLDSGQKHYHLWKVLGEWAKTEKFLSWNDLREDLKDYEVCPNEITSSVIFETLVKTESPSEKIDELLQILVKLCEITNDDPTVLFQCAFFAFNAHHSKLCTELLDRIPAKDSAVLTLKGQAFEDLADYDAALTCFQQATEQNPKDATAWFQLARLSAATGNFSEAKMAANACHGLSPGQEVDVIQILIGKDSGDLKYLEEAACRLVDSLSDNPPTLTKELFIDLVELFSDFNLKTLCEKIIHGACLRSAFIIQPSELGKFAKLSQRLFDKKWYNQASDLNDLMSQA